MSQVTEQSVRFQTALASIKLIQASAVLDLTEDDFDFLTSNKVWIATDRSRARRCVEACVYGKIGKRFSRNAETDLVCRLLLEKKKLELNVPSVSVCWDWTPDVCRLESCVSYRCPTLNSHPS